jgi:RNA polymerase sigma factor (sigma-70 family)
MAQGDGSNLLWHIRRLAGAPSDDRLTDGELLQQFVGRRQEASFAELLRRHGPMVLAVCRRVLDQEQDAEDAFQAAFLVLAQKADSIRAADSVASWLCRVAYHIAVAAQSRAARRRAFESQAAALASTRSQPAVRDHRLMLDEELNCLPRKYQAPLVLCYLEGKSHQEAARELRWPIGTVKARLARARAMLRLRLTRRNLTFSAGLAGAQFLEKTAEVAVPAALLAATVKAAVLCTTGAAAAGVISMEVLALVKGGTNAMFVAKLKIAAAVVLVVTMLGTGAGFVTHRVLAGSQRDSKAKAEAADLPEPARTNTGGGRELASLTRHTGAVLAVACAPRVKLIATGSSDKTVRLWDTSTKKEVATLQGHAEKVLAVAFTPDGRIIASASADKTVKLWDAATRKELATLEHPDTVNSLAFSPDGKLLATGDRDSSLRFWEVASRKIDRRLRAHEDPITSVVFSSDGKALVEGSADGAVAVWGLDTGRQVYRVEAHQDEVTSLAVSPDGKILASASADKTVKLFELATGTELTSLAGHSGAVQAVAFDPAGKRLATASADKTVRLWDTASGKELVRLKGHTGEVTCVTFGSDGTTLFTGSADKTIKVWNVSK